MFQHGRGDLRECIWPRGTFPGHNGNDDVMSGGSSERDESRTLNRLAMISTTLAWLVVITYFLSENITFPLNSRVISGRSGRSLTVPIKRMRLCSSNCPTEWLRNSSIKFSRVSRKIHGHIVFETKCKTIFLVADLFRRYWHFRTIWKHAALSVGDAEYYIRVTGAAGEQDGL